MISGEKGEKGNAYSTHPPSLNQNRTIFYKTYTTALPPLLRSPESKSSKP